MSTGLKDPVDILNFKENNVQLSNTFYWMDLAGQKKLWVVMMEPGVEDNVVVALVTTAKEIVEADLHYFTSTRLYPATAVLFKDKKPDFNEIYLGVGIGGNTRAPVIHAYAKAATTDELKASFYSGLESKGEEFKKLIDKVRVSYPKFKTMTVELKLKGD